MRIVHTQIDIEAAPGIVWDVLTDVSKYAEWNPFIRTAYGSINVSERLRLRVRLSPLKSVSVKPTILFVQERRELRWLEWLLIPGLLDGEHSFVIEAQGGDRSHLVQHETFTGLLVPFIMRSQLLREIESGCDEMNSALKIRAEQNQFDAFFLND